MAQYRLSNRFLGGFLLLALIIVVKSDDSCNLDFEKTLAMLFTPQDQPSLQVRSLRRYLLRLLQNIVAKAEEVEGWNNYSYPKRNLEALARAGYLHTLPEEEEDNQTDAQDKRSLASLVKNGQLPEHHYPEEEEGSKRSAQLFSRNGDLKSEIQRMFEEFYGNVPVPQESYTKRNVASIARDGGFGGKRNAAALLKNDRYLNQFIGHGTEQKKNIASLKANYKPKYKREVTKREADYYGEDEEYPSYQSLSDYENLVDQLLDGQQTQKRFLGSVARTGWYDSPRSSSIARMGQKSPPGKRHIGSLARLGWLPTIRNIRRFSRSGRSPGGGTSCRETSSNGQDQDYYFSENSIPSYLENKRFYPVPAMWKVPLQTVNY